MNTPWRAFRRQALPAWIGRLAIASGFSRFGINSTWLLAARLVVQVQAVLLTILIARRFDQAVFGQYSFIVALIFLGNVLTTFGTDTLLIRQIAQSGRSDIPEVRAVLLFQILFSILVVAAIWLWTAAVPSPASAEEIASLRLYSLSLLPLALFSVFSAILRGLERMDLALFAALGTAFLQVFAVWLVLQAGSRLPDLMGALLAVQVFAMVFSYLLCRSAIPTFQLRIDADRQLLLRVLKAAWPLAALSILGVAYLRLEVFALSFLGNDHLIGLYSAASRVVEALKLGHIAVLGALLPALARLQGKPDRMKDAQRLFHRAIWGLLVFGFLGAIGATLFAPQLVVILFGEGYAAAIFPLKILAWLLIPYSISSVLAVELVTQRKEKTVTLALAAGLAAAGALNLLWIPLWGVEGACLAAVVAEGVQAGILGGWRLWRTHGSTY